MKSALTIHTASEGGFFVLAVPTERGYMSNVLYAGTLDECLAFIRAKLTVGA